MTYMVYPGATHRRFEHSLGVMHVAGQIFDVVTEREHMDDRTRRRLPIGEDDWHRKGSHWRFILRLAALCHDLGHLPFSHGAEALLPEGENHENMTIRLIEGEHLSRVWRQINPSPSSSQIARIATKPKLFPLEPFDEWETILNEVIAGNFSGLTGSTISYATHTTLVSRMAVSTSIASFSPFELFRNQMRTALYLDWVSPKED